jgi:hypothetical protein
VISIVSIALLMDLAVATVVDEIRSLSILIFSFWEASSSRLIVRLYSHKSIVVALRISWNAIIVSFRMLSCVVVG